MVSELGPRGEFEYRYDIGGTPGYELFLEILGNRGYEQHEDMVRWIGGVFDPKGFDLNRINRDFKSANKRRR